MADAQVILTTQQARDHLRASPADDPVIAELIPAAIASLEDHLGRPLLDATRGWASPADLPANVVHAVKVILTDLFENRCTPLADMGVIDRLVGRYVIVSIG
ncbi:head-tail connector protein [Sphingomonas aquatilis]|uniref:head-tail connector protein n=1 Tax=Sphingomonas aquatilis TaxID=93063 RepID=UPI0023FA0877|nr:head-tail connector protein [Sphingomonas aquatilis]MCI4653121.1 head-tail connector protein [Sphingomonas aquatilis]